MHLLFICVLSSIICSSLANPDNSHLQWAMKKLLSDDNNCDITQAPGNVIGMQGRPGKVGPKGERGNQGPQGPVGRTGSCECDLSDLEILRQEINTLRGVVFGERLCLAGMKDGNIPDSAISASSNHPHTTCFRTYARLDSIDGWCAATGNPGEWIQVDLGKTKKITGIMTQGRNQVDQWAKKFKIMFGETTSSLSYIVVYSQPKIFQVSPPDRQAKIVSMFPEPIEARFVRIEVVEFQGHGMRFDLIDC